MILKNLKNNWENTDLLNIVGEIWSPIVGYGGFYLVSNMGRVKSLDKTVYRVVNGKKTETNILFYKGKILKQNNLQTGGYCSVKLCNNGKQYNLKVHRLVAESFIENKENKPCVNHINGIKTDNRVENLEWCTYSENNIHAFKTGLNKVKKEFLLKGYKNPKSKPVNQYSLNGDFIRQYGSQQEASRITGVDQSMIFNCCKGVRQKTAGGFKWSYADGYGWGRKGAEFGKPGFIINNHK